MAGNRRRRLYAVLIEFWSDAAAAAFLALMQRSQEGQVRVSISRLLNIVKQSFAVHFCTDLYGGVGYITNRKRVKMHSRPPTYLIESFTSMPETTDRCAASAALEQLSNSGMEILAILKCDFC